MNIEAVIGLEIHAELKTDSKMFCACPVVDPTQARPNTAVCPVCSGMPGTLPVLNGRAVEFGLRVALALQCEIQPTSIFARKNYFYPDLPKGYQISQYEQPLAVNGRIRIYPSSGEKVVRVRRVHLEEDTGKLTHVPGESETGEGSFSLVDLNRAGVPLLEIVSEPDLRTPEEARLYAQAIHSLLRYLEVNSGDLQKGALRIEPNISVRLAGSQKLGTRTEIKNLNSFRALERSLAYEIQRQTDRLEEGQPVIQETRGWDDSRGMTFSQRSKEEADDYRYFPEPDLPALTIEMDWLEKIRQELPELPAAKLQRFREQYALSDYDASILVSDRALADYYEAAAAAALQESRQASPKLVANWLTGELFALLNQAGAGIEESKVAPSALGELVALVAQGNINASTGKLVLAEMYSSGAAPAEIVAARGLGQIKDSGQIAGWVRETLENNPEQVSLYLDGKESLLRWLFGQVMRRAGGKASPEIIQQELERQIDMRRGAPPNREA